MSSKRRSSGIKRGSRGGKQPGIVETFARVRPSCAAIEESLTVIDLDSDDPYKFVDSQSLLPDDDDDDDGGISDARATPAALWAASSSHAKKARVDSNADELTTPKRTGTVAVGGSVTGSAKRKQTTPKSKKASVADDSWSQDELESAIAASIQEKQREDRRNRLRIRETKLEEEEQLRLLMECEGTMAAECDSDKELEGPFSSKEKAEQIAQHQQQPECEPDLPFSSSLQPRGAYAEEPLSAVSAATVTHQLALKSVSLNRLSVKLLQTKRDGRNETVSDDKAAPLREQGETGCSDEVMIIDKEPTRKSARKSDTRSLSRNKKSNLLESEDTTDFERHLSGDEDVPDDYKDDTPPLSEFKSVTEDSNKVRAIVDKPLLKATRKAVHSREALQGEEESVGKDQTPVLSNRTRSTKIGLSLKKSRKRLSDTDNSSFQEVQSSSEQGPLAKRPKVQKNNEDCCISESSAKSGAPGTKQLPSGREVAVVGREKNVKMAKISLTDIKKSQDSITKRVDSAKNQKSLSSVNLVKEDSEHDEKDEVCGKSEVKTGNATTTANGLTTENKTHLPLVTTERQQVNQQLARKENTTLPNRAFRGRGNNGYMVKRKASGWPLVKVRPSEKPRVPSLQAPPGVPTAEHTRVLVRCFDEYFDKLAMAQCKVLCRVKWGQPVSNVNKTAANSLNAGRRTKRSRTTNIPYSEYALDLKSAPSVSKSRSSSPAVVGKHSSSKRSLSKSPGVSVRGEMLTPSDSDDDFVLPKSTEKNSDRRREQVQRATSGRKRLSFTKERKVAGESTPSKSPRGTESHLSPSKRKSPQQRGQLGKSSKSPALQFEREESPDIVLTRNACEKRSEVNLTSHSATPPALTNDGGCDHSATPTLQDDDVMMFDLTSPSPPPLGSPNENEAKLDNGGRERPQVHVRAAVTSHSRIGHDTDDFDNEEECPPPDAANLKKSHSSVLHDIDSFSEEDEQGHPHSTVTASSSSSWLNARKPPPVQSKSKKPATKRSRNVNTPKSNVQTKKKATSASGGRGGKGKRSTKKPVSASMRIKALIQNSDSDSEHNSEEESQSANLSKTTSSKRLPKNKTSGRQALGSSDSDLSDMEFDDHAGGCGSPLSVSLIENKSPVDSSEEEDDGRRSERDRHTLEGVIDLTSDSQIPPRQTSNSVPSSHSESPGDGCVPCPMCGERFDSLVIQLHAEQCEGPESPRDDRWSEDITRYATASSSKGKPSDGKRRGSLSMRRGGRRGRQSYQPSLKQLVSKEKEVNGENDIDSSTTADEQEDALNGEDMNFGDFTAADRGEGNYDDDHLDWTEREGSAGTSRGTYGVDTPPEYGGGGGGFIRESSVGSEANPEAAIQYEDGEGGYIIDPNMISNSPIRTFKKLSELDPQERAGFDNQFKSKRGRGRRNQRGRQPMTVEDRRSATWGRNDFGDLFDSSERSKGQRGRGGYRGRRPFKYDWKKARGRARGRSNSRGRRS